MKNNPIPLLLLLTFLLTAVIFALPAQAYAAGVPGQVNPTPAPEVAHLQTPSFSLPPIFAVVVLLVPAWMVIMKARWKKNAQVKEAGCLPVVDGEKFDL